MRLYLAVARSSFRRFSTYRWATVTGVLVNSVFGAIRSFVLLAVWAHNPNIGGFDAVDAVTYCWLTQSLIMTTGIFGGGYVDELAERLRSGDIVVDLYRPTDLQGWWLASEIGRATFGFLASGIQPTIIGALLFHLRFPDSVWVWMLFLLSAFIGVVVGFSIRFIVALAAFWLVDSRGITFLVNTAGMFLSGFILPLTMFPDRLAGLARALPWASMIQTPIDVFLGQAHGWALAEVLGARSAGPSSCSCSAARSCESPPVGWWCKVAELAGAIADGIRGYGMIASMWIRSAVAYRTSFVALASAQFVVTGLDFVMILILFTHTHEVGGFPSAEVLFLYAGSGLAFAFADLGAGSLEMVGRRIRDGSLDSLLVRPIPVLAQLAADQFAIRRVGRILQAGTVFVVALITGDIAWTPAKVVLTLVMIVSGTAVFVGIYMLGACFQFVAGDAAEVSNAFTYGGDALSQLPWTIYPRELVRTVVLVLPIAFISWIPAAWILDRPLPLGMPAFMAWTSPLAAAALLTVAGLLWRFSQRSYRSTGS